MAHRCQQWLTGANNGSPVPTMVHRCQQCFTGANNGSPVPTMAHRCQKWLTGANNGSPVPTIVHRCQQWLTGRWGDADLVHCGENRERLIGPVGTPAATSARTTHRPAQAQGSNVRLQRSPDVLFRHEGSHMEAMGNLRRSHLRGVIRRKFTLQNHLYNSWVDIARAGGACTALP
jgi:hypothetical protein